MKCTKNKTQYWGYNMTIKEFIETLKVAKVAEYQLSNIYNNSCREEAIIHKAKAQAYDYVIFQLVNFVMWVNEEGE